ncbi:hypothetical protein [Cryobacterium sp. SO1]|nr:hypothetical protein [Cryobacterium sp. SO1]RZI36609.1 hypothetical protein BJQ95_00982 [Cryobacterium sp. SO1]
MRRFAEAWPEHDSIRGRTTDTTVHGVLGADGFTVIVTNAA